ncbi:MAG: C40 family peptidase [Lachnospiraceae bacterium]|nr:C40 family peptidase [Lachnospiraceae bacterium]
MRKRIVRLLCLSLAMLLVVHTNMSVWADKISDLKEQNKQDQAALDELDEEMENLELEQEGIASDMQEVELAIVDLMASIALIEEDIETKQSEIAQAELDLTAAQVQEQEQYEAMKLRIQYMYEKGETSYLELLMQASSFQSALNNADYIEQMYAYDRKMLTQYEETRQQIEEMKESLELEYAELEVSKAECEMEQAGLEDALAELAKLSEDYELQISKAKQEAEVYKSKIKKQNAEIKKLEEEAARKAREEAERLAAMKNKPIGTAKVDTASIMAANGSAKGKEIAIYACGFVGNKYVWGGTSLTNGADCSGFTQSVYKAFGYKIPRTSYQQRSAGKAVTYAEAQPGDLICYAGHVAMYIGNGRIVHASSAKTGIIIGYATYKPILAVRRIV